MATGIDTNQVCTPHLQCLQNNGITFVGRYYAMNSSPKRLKLAEAQAISQAGMHVVAVWETGFPTTPGFFSHAKGVLHGTTAYHYALEAIGQPAGTPIYFGVDFDAAQTHIVGGITDYFHGIGEAFNTIGHNQPVYKIGVYGSGKVCAWLLNHDLASFTWLAQSTGWAGFHQFTDWNIKQGPTHNLCGLDVDGDETKGNGGGFQVT